MFCGFQYPFFFKNHLASGFCVTLNSIYLETARRAIFTHDWVLASKAVEGLCEERMPTHRLDLMMMWNVKYHNYTLYD